jgi:hypothetical protein
MAPKKVRKAAPARKGHRKVAMILVALFIGSVVAAMVGAFVLAKRRRLAMPSKRAKKLSATGESSSVRVAPPLNVRMFAKTKLPQPTDETDGADATPEHPSIHRLDVKKLAALAAEERLSKKPPGVEDKPSAAPSLDKDANDKVDTNDQPPLLE